MTKSFLTLGLSLLVLGYFPSQGQNNSLQTSKKPTIDSSQKNKSSLQRISELGGKTKDESANWKKESKAILSELGIENIGSKLKNSSKKKKVEIKDEYLGIKTERRIGTYGSGNRTTVEELNVVKYVEDEAVSPYSQEIWWYDPAQSRVVNSPIKDSKNAQICHGPYRKFVHENLVEEGHFFMGVKDGRWENYGQEFELENKQYYKKGFPAESIISYYDKEHKKIKEVIPKTYGKIAGQFLSFYPNGLLKEEGKLDDSVKVGRWREYHEKGSGGRLKKEWRYGKDKFDNFTPVLVQERDNQAKIIFQSTQKFD
ncbi:toxin-antitoxin system YwqK family antitoxin [Aquirufa ecclesiirivi]|uniref:toxin-antitoxin system YwqK family antitoxin n=1 Tax=Aquirufa ecclesiirivi TaxID=2715124 RepID=UPI003BB1195C